MATISVNPGDVFVKNDRVISRFVVERLLTYTDIPPHVRLIERGGNERTVTVALQTLLDEKYWLPEKKKLI